MPLDSPENWIWITVNISEDYRPLQTLDIIIVTSPSDFRDWIRHVVRSIGRLFDLKTSCPRISYPSLRSSSFFPLGGRDFTRRSTFVSRCLWSIFRGLIIALETKKKKKNRNTPASFAAKTAGVGRNGKRENNILRYPLEYNQRRFIRPCR